MANGEWKRERTSYRDAAAYCAKNGLIFGRINASPRPRRNSGTWLTVRRKHHRREFIHQELRDDVTARHRPDI